jgi:hypothetical protein
MDYSPAKHDLKQEPPQFRGGAFGSINGEGREESIIPAT